MLNKFLFSDLGKKKIFKVLSIPKRLQIYNLKKDTISSIRFVAVAAVFVCAAP